jgi:hypothetical protein
MGIIRSEIKRPIAKPQIKNGVPVSSVDWSRSKSGVPSGGMALTQELSSKLDEVKAAYNDPNTKISGPVKNGFVQGFNNPTRSFEPWWGHEGGYGGWVQDQVDKKARTGTGKYDPMRSRQSNVQSKPKTGLLQPPTGLQPFNKPGLLKEMKIKVRRKLGIKKWVG